MIVRILAEGQYDMEGPALHDLKLLDQRLFAAVAGSDPAEYRAAFDDVLALVRSGRCIPVDHLTESDLVLPAADTDLAGARRLFAPEG